MQTLYAYTEAGATYPAYMNISAQPTGDITISVRSQGAQLPYAIVLPEGNLPFGLAIMALKAGKRVARTGWNGKGMWLALQPGSVITPEQARGGAAKGRAEEGATTIDILPHIDMRAADGSIVVGWLASQTDMLADDWQILK